MLSLWPLLASTQAGASGTVREVQVAVLGPKGEGMKQIWFGCAGHLCIADSCRYRLHTHVGQFCISSVGEYYPSPNDKKPSPVGGSGYFETYIFDLDAGDGRWEEIGGVRANTWATTHRNHMRLLSKYARKATRATKTTGCCHEAFKEATNWAEVTNGNPSESRSQ